MIIASYNILDWHWVNLVAPFIGLLGCLVMFFSSKTCTVGKAVSTAVSLSMVMWLMLIWADWGSAVFAPSYQSMWSRLLVIAISMLVMFELKRLTIERHQREHDIKVLMRKNQALITQNKILKSRHSKPAKRNKHITKKAR